MRKKNHFNENWLFLEHDITSNDSYLPIHKKDYKDAHWRQLDLPHDSSIEGVFDAQNMSGPRGGYAPVVLSYYRKHFEIDEKMKGKQITITFNGVYCNSTVYLNGHCLGNYPYGYSSFSYDLTPYMIYGEDNVLAVKVDNEMQPGSRWYSGTGIYRDVTLEFREKLHIDEESIIVNTVSCDEKKSKVNVEAQLSNDTLRAQKVNLAVRIKDKGKKVVASQIIEGIVVGATDKEAISIDFELEQAKLWCADQPYLYHLEIKLLQIDEESEPVDTVSVRFGIRTITFDADKGFMINGKKERLKGVCMHHDNGCLGACAYKDAFIRKLEIMRAMGANAIRTTHNPEDPVFLDLCDEYGFYVMEEAFDEWTWGKRPRVFGDWNVRKPIFAYAQYFKQWAETDLSKMIIRDRNHPSIILWSIGNEIEELRHEDGEPLTKWLVAIVHQHDKTRLATVGCNGLAAINETKNPDLVDVCGYNYAETFYEKDHVRKPNRCMIGSETSSATAFEPRGCYDQFIRSKGASEGISSEGEADPEFQSIQQVNTTNTMGRLYKGELSWQQHVANDHVAGLFIWTGIDYIGEPTPYTWPSISSYFAPVDRALFPKDAFYFYQSIWSEQTVLHLLPHWTHEGWEGKKLPVWAYTNCEEVELFVNGKSYGKKQLGADGLCHLEWNEVVYEPGELRAVGLRKGHVIEEVIRTALKAEKLEIIKDREILAKKELVYVEINVKDAKGSSVPHGQYPITIKTSEHLEVLGVDNGLQTNPVFKGGEIKAWAGKARIILQAKRCGEGSLQVTSHEMTAQTTLQIK